MHHIVRQILNFGPGEAYRLGIVAFIFDERGDVLMGEMQKMPGSWTVVQGGADRNLLTQVDESPRQALVREMREEVRLRMSQEVGFLAVHPELIIEKFEDNRKKYDGKAIYGFAMLHDSATPPDVSTSKAFSRLAWHPLEDIPRLTDVEHYRRAYELLAASFEDIPRAILSTSPRMPFLQRSVEVRRILQQTARRELNYFTPSSFPHTSYELPGQPVAPRQQPVRSYELAF